jgi:lipopolysaccharide transport system permease protein
LWPDWRWLGIPLFLGIACAAALGAGLWFAAWNVKYRDFRYIMPYVIQFGLFVSPVGFSAAVVPLKWKWVYSLNPMVGVINGFRWSLLNGRTRLDWPAVLFSLGISLLLLYLGVSHFQKAEREFADII